MKNRLYTHILPALVLIVLGIGCSRFVDSENPVRSLPAAAPAPINLSARIDNGSVTLSWELSDSSAVKRFRLYLTDATGENARLRDTTVGLQFSRTISGLQTNQQYNFVVASVGLTGIEGNRSTPLTITSILVSISINNGSEYTNSRDVTLTLNAPNAATHVMLSESTDLTGAQFEPFQSSKSFRFSNGDGLKHVYARFIFSDGTQTGAAVTDSIRLDTKAEIDSVWFTPASGTLAFGSVITFALKTGETGGQASVSFTGSTSITLADDGIAPDATAGDGIYTGRYVVPSDLSVSNGVVTGSFTDAAGNQAAKLTSVQTITISNSPVPVEFTTLAALSSSAVSVGWTPSSNSDFSAYRLYRSTFRAVSDTSKLVRTVTDKNATILVDTALAENTKYFYRVYVYNAAGNSAQSPLDSATTFVNVAPTAVVLAASMGDTNTVHLSWSQNTDEDFLLYRLYRSTDTVGTVDITDDLVAIIGAQGTTSYSDTFQGSQTAYAYRIFVFDKQGKSTGSNKAVVVK
jgi:fibronectin type 3 domain-containing protein